MKPNPLSRVLILLLGIVVASPLSVAQNLPDLGEAAQTDFSPAMERRIGESIMLEIRRDPAYLDDSEVASYLNRLGSRLAAQSADSRQEFELFALRDPTLNAFAMPGGFIGVHSGLILAAASESEPVSYTHLLLQQAGGGGSVLSCDAHSDSAAQTGLILEGGRS